MPTVKEVLALADEDEQPTFDDVLTITTPFRMELVRVPAGEFLMGSDPAKDKDAYDKEKPQHPVRLDEFYIGKYPVTNAQYAVFVKATKRKAPTHWKNGVRPRGKGEHPVVNVSWYDAVAFCTWLAKATGRPFRLPSEAEWEKAASWDEKTRQKRIWPWGNAFDAAKCNTSEGKERGSTPVGAYSLAGGDSPCRAADMAGNVWEWTNSLFKGYPYDPKDGREDPNDSGSRVLRGGSFLYGAWDARCAYRVGLLPDLWNDDYGFRIGVSPGLSTPGLRPSGTS
jgi:formylglycine-generating enzyme required for sulfatase activity